MPAPSGYTTPAATAAADQTRELPFQFTTFFAPPPINAKNVASQYVRNDNQLWTGRNPTSITAGLEALRAKKRKRPSQQGTNEGEDAEVDVSMSDDADEEVSVTEGTSSTSSNTIVIHPGTQHLRIGLASDLSPVTIPHVVARRLKDNPDSHEGADLNESEEGDSSRTSDLAQGSDALRADLKSIMRNMKLRPVANGRQQASNYNAGVKPEKLAEHQDVFAIDWVDSAKEKEDMLWGEKAERIDAFSTTPTKPSKSSKTSPKEDGKVWKRFQPFKGGHFNYGQYAEEYGSYAAQEALLRDITAIWSKAIEASRETEKETASQIVEQGLGIARTDWQHYNVILLVSDLSIQAEVESLVGVLLDDMGFGAVMLMQESVCATFGAGLSSACVVHVGSEQTQIACVDEGMLVAESRVSLAYGGDQVSQYFLHLLHRSNFPYENIDAEKRLADRWLANELKERFCTLDPTQLGLAINDFHVRLPGKPTLKYSMRTYDEIIIGPMCLFNTRVIPFASETPKLLPFTSTALITDDEGEQTKPGTLQVTAAMTGCVRHLLPALKEAPVVPLTTASATTVTTANPTAEHSKASTPAPGVTTTETQPTLGDGGSAVPSQRVSPMPSTDRKPATIVKANGASTAADGESTTSAIESTVDIVYESSKISIDWAVWNSVLASVSTMGSVAQSEERVKRLIANIFCTGGTALLPGLGMAIEARVHNYLGQWYAQQAKDVNSMPTATVIPPPRDMDPRIVSWKGMAVMSKLDGASDMWISRGEWSMFGMRAVREKAFFL